MISFYTTKEQETILDSGYLNAIAKKQEEIDKKENKTGKFAKYRATIYFRRSERVFRVIDNVAYLQLSSGRYKWVPCPSMNVVDFESSPLTSSSVLYPPIPPNSKLGCIYKPDHDLLDQVQGFLQRHKNYEVSFADKKSGTVYYGGEGYPATMIALPHAKAPKLMSIENEVEESGTLVKSKRRKRKRLFTVKKKRKAISTGTDSSCEEAELPRKRTRAEVKESKEVLYLIDDDKYDIACG